MVENWRPHGPDMNVIKVIGEIPERTEERVDRTSRKVPRASRGLISPKKTKAKSKAKRGANTKPKTQGRKAKHPPHPDQGKVRHRQLSERIHRILGLGALLLVLRRILDVRDIDLLEAGRIRRRIERLAHAHRNLDAHIDAQNQAVVVDFEPAHVRRKVKARKIDLGERIYIVGLRALRDRGRDGDGSV